MILTAPEHGPVLYVASQMRDVDRREIYGIRWSENPFHIVNDVMARPDFSWVAWHDGKPAVVIGGMERHPGTWAIFCFGTDDWAKLALPLTRFVKKKMLPILFDELGARRLEADSHCEHVQAHRWMEFCGAHREGVKRGYGRDGSDYHTYTILAPAKLDI